MLYHIRDMVLHRRQQRGVCPSARSDPSGELFVPHQVMASHLLATRFGQIDGDLAAGVAELVLVWLHKLPFHLICGSDFAKYPGVVEH